jgi:hypothetical protein
VFNRDKSGNILCGFYEDKNYNLTLPTIQIMNGDSFSTIAMSFFSELIEAPLSGYEVIQNGFFEIDNYIFLAYNLIIPSWLPVDKKLKFISREDAEVSKNRITKPFFHIYTKGLLGQ